MKQAFKRVKPAKMNDALETKVLGFPGRGLSSRRENDGLQGRNTDIQSFCDPQDRFNTGVIDK